MLVHVIEDDQAVGRTICRSLVQAGREAVLYDSADRFVEQIDAAPFGCVVTDVRMPGMSGTDLIKILHAKRPELPVIMMTGFGEVTAAVTSFRHGAVHFLQKPFKRDELIAALDEAEQVGRRRRADADRHQQTAALDKLTKREREILAALAKGLQSKTVAWEFGISIRTVEMHRSNILAKLGARNTSQAVGLLQMAEAA